MKTDKTKDLTDDRGSNYGHPYDHFQCTQSMFAVWQDRRMYGKNLPPPMEKCLHHIVYFILDKLTRAAENPCHMDNFEDIQGYASLWEVSSNKHEEVG